MALLSGTSAMDGGTLAPIPPNASNGQQITAINDIINRLNGMLKSQYFSDGTTRRMLIGYQVNGWGTGKNFGIKISKEGIDVTKADDTQLLFKMDLEEWNWYDANNGNNPIRIGKMPDGTYNVIAVGTGENVADAFTS